MCGRVCVGGVVFILGANDFCIMRVVHTQRIARQTAHTHIHRLWPPAQYVHPVGSPFHMRFFFVAVVSRPTRVQPVAIIPPESTRRLAHRRGDYICLCVGLSNFAGILMKRCVWLLSRVLLVRRPPCPPCGPENNCQLTKLCAVARHFLAAHTRANVCVRVDLWRTPIFDS